MRVSDFRNAFPAFGALVTVLTAMTVTPDRAHGSAGDFVGALTFGAAANINAASPMVVAGIEAATDVEVAKINSDLIKYQMDSAVGVAKHLSDNAAAVARAQGLAALDIFRIQQAGINYRFDRQLTALREVRKDQMAFTLAGLKKQWQFQDRYLDILAMQGRYNEKIARLALQYQLSAQGLNSYFPQNGLTVTGSPAFGAFGGTPSPLALTVSTGRRPQTAAARAPATLTVAGALSRYPGRPHGASARGGQIRPLSTHATN